MTIIFNCQPEREKRRQLRKNMPEAEIILWSHLKEKKLHGYKFRRQYGIDRYVVDFYCAEVQLVIEIDGDSHFTDEAVKYDQHRESFIQSFGIQVIRFTNLEVHKNIDEVLHVILEVLTSLCKSPLRRLGDTSPS